MLDKELFKLLGKDKKYVSIITIIDLIGVLINISITGCICYIINLSIEKVVDMNRYIPFFILGLILSILKIVTIFISSKLRYSLGNKIKKNMRSMTYKKILSMGFTTSEEKIASLTQMSIEGVEQVDTYYSYYLPSFFNAMTAPLMLFVICLFFKWQVAVVLLIALPLIPISIVLVSKWAKKIFAKYWDKYTTMGNSFYDNLQGMKELKIFNADALKQVEIDVKSEEFRKVTMKVLVMQLWSLTIIDTVAFGAAAIAIVIAVNGAITPVNPITPATALFLILISAEFFLPMRTLASAFHVAMSGTTAGKKIKSFLELQEPVWGTKEVENPNILKLENVKFAYDNEHYVLNNISMTFKKGFNAVVGESGSGKSTIISLLLGSYTPNIGKVSLNDISIRDYNRNSYYSKIATVSYNTFIFNTSIRENFFIAKKNITDEEIYHVLETVNLKDFVLEMGGLDYVILEDSENISGGQRQRLALAINLVNDSDIYLFDEATSNIDVESEKIIIDHIKELAKSKIVIVISHRLANVVDADNIFMLKDGTIIEQGKHNDLLKLDREYSKIYKEQYLLENGYKEVAIHD